MLRLDSVLNTLPVASNISTIPSLPSSHIHSKPDSLKSVVISNLTLLGFNDSFIHQMHARTQSNIQLQDNTTEIKNTQELCTNALINQLFASKSMGSSNPKVFEAAIFFLFSKLFNEDKAREVGIYM